MKWSVLVTLIYLVTSVAHAASTNAGFIQGLWYSENSFHTGDTVRVYVAVRNNTGNDLTGTVKFFDNNVPIGSSPVAALSDHIVESWTDWKATYGTHTLSASLTQVGLSAAGTSSSTITVVSPLASDVVFVNNPPAPPSNNISPANQGGTTQHAAAIPGAKTATSSASSRYPLINPTEGIEQYLPVSSASNILNAVTDIATHAKANLDAYRTSLVKTNPITTPLTTLDIPVNASGFGTITRTISAHTKPTAQLPSGAAGTWLTKIGGIIYTFYLSLLATLSWTLGHPILVQLGLLFSILFALLKTAQRLSRRNY